MTLREGWSALRESRLASDALIATGWLVALVALRMPGDGLASLLTLDFAAIAVGCVALVWRRTAPLTVLAITWALYVAATLATDQVSSAYMVFAVAVHTAVSHVQRVRRAIATGMVATGASAVPMLVAYGWADDTAEIVLILVLTGLVAAVGLAVAMYRKSLAAERARAVEAEETREALAQTRVAQERLRIARELHDAVGHHIAVMNVQAGVAEALLESDRDRAAAALASVQEAGAKVLEELPLMLKVLRQDEDDDRPGVGLDQVEDLIAQAQAAGLTVTSAVAGLPARLPDGVDQAAYRIVQEALTNATRHGDGNAVLEVAVDPEAVVIRVSNPIGAPGTSGSGFGLVGMRERAAAADGSLETGREGDLFVVRATLPARRGGSDEGGGR